MKLIEDLFDDIEKSENNTFVGEIVNVKGENNLSISDIKGKVLTIVDDGTLNHSCTLDCSKLVDPIKFNGITIINIVQKITWKTVSIRLENLDTLNKFDLTWNLKGQYNKLQLVIKKEIINNTFNVPCIGCESYPTYNNVINMKNCTFNISDDMCFNNISPTKSDMKKCTINCESSECRVYFTDLGDKRDVIDYADYLYKNCKKLNFESKFPIKIKDFYEINLKAANRFDGLRPTKFCIFSQKSTSMASEHIHKFKDGYVINKA